MGTRRLLISILILFFFSPLYATVKGSETAVSVEGNVTFPAADTDNIMLGFGWFKNGFSLEDTTTTCTFNSIYPVLGTIDLNGGKLVLLQDLIFNNSTTLSGLGNVVGKNHKMQLCSSITSFPADTNSFEDTNVYCDADLTITSSIIFKGNSSLCGVGSVLILDGQAELIVDSSSVLELRDIEIRNIKGTNIRCVDDSAQLVLDNVRLVQDGWFDWKNGAITFKDSVSLMGSSTLSYASLQTSTISACSEFVITDNMHVCMGKDPVTLNNPLAFVDRTSTLKLDNCSFIITKSGLDLTKGTMIFERDVEFDSLGTTTQNGIIMGNGNEAEDIVLWFKPGAAAIHNSGYWVYNNGSPNNLKSSSKTARMIRNLGSKIYLPKSLNLNDITVKLASALVSPIEIGTGALLSYNDSSIKLPDIDFDITSDQLNAFTYSLDGNNSLFLTKGTLPLYLLVTGAANQLRGNGGLTGAVTLANSAAHFTCGINGFIDNAVVLNSGTFVLGYDLLMRDNGSILGPGMVNLDSNTLEFDTGFSAATPIYWEGSRGKLLFNGKVTLSSTWTFKGKNTITGNNAKLVLAQGGEIVIDKDSQLTFKNIPIYGIEGTNVRCIDDDGVLTILHAQIYQTDDYLFDKGSIKFFLENSWSGNYTFSYDSIHTSTIRTDGSLCVKDGLTFALGRTNGVEPLEFQDNTGKIIFEDSTLKIKETGIQFAKGQIIAQNRVDLDIAGTTTSTGLIVGTGNSTDDVMVQLTPGSAIWHNSGYWVYNNSTADKLSSTSTTASLVRNLNSLIYIAQDLTISNLSIQLLSNFVTPLQVATGKTVSYDQGRVKLPEVELELSATQVNAFTYALQGSDELFFTKGTLPLYLLVSGTNNTLRGNGDITGMVTLQDAVTELTCGISGFIDNLITLNNGKVTLESDLLLLANSGVIGPGICDLQANLLTFCIGTLNANSPIAWHGNNGTIGLQGQLSLSSTWTFNGKCVVNANDNRIILNSGADLVVDKDSELVLKNAEIHGVGGHNICCLNENGRITFLNCIVFLDNDYSFTVGSMQFFRKTHFTGPYTFSYDSAKTSTIRKDAELIVKNDATLFIGRNNGVEPLAFEDSSSKLKFDNATFRIKPTGMTMLKGTAVTSRDVEVIVDSNEQATGLTFGDGTAANDMKFQINPGSTARYPSGAVTLNVTTNDAINSKSKSAELIRGATSAYFLKQNLVLADLSVSVDPLSTLVIDPGKSLSYSNGRIMLDQGVFDLTGIRYSDTTTLLNGNHKIVLINGSLPMATLVNGANNSITGNGNVTGPIFLSNATTQLTCGITGLLIGNVTLNSGSFILGSDLSLSNNTQFLTDGIVAMNACNIYLGKTENTWSNNIWWSGSGASLQLNAKLSLQGTWTIVGDVTIKGNNQTLDLGTNGAIEVAANATLTCQDIHFEGISDTNVSCSDNANLILDNVIWGQSNNSTFIFNTGAIRFKNKVVMKGNSSFVYASNQTSTICQDASLLFDTNMTFSYDPIGCSNLFELESNSSKLICNNATIHITTTGLQLIKGSLQIKGDTSIYTETETTLDEFGNDVLTDYGISLGDGITTANDCRCEVATGSTLTIVNGSLHYNNLSSDSWFMENNFSTLRIPRKVKLAVNQTLPLGAGQLILHEKALLALAPNKQIIGSVFIDEES